MSETKEDPARLALRASPKPVTRLNRRVIAVAATSVAVLVGGVALWSLQPKKQTAPDPKASELKQAQKVSPAEGLSVLPRDYAGVPTTSASSRQIQASTDVPELGAPAGELGRPILRAERQAGIESTESGDGFDLDPHQDAVRADRLRRAQEDETAAKSQVFFQLRGKQTSTIATGEASPTDPAVDRLLKLMPNAASGVPSEAAEQSAGSGNQNSKQAFLQRAVDRKIYADGVLQTPQSEYQLMAGSVISAALVTAINSDLPGQIVASVTQNVYDTVTGNFLLVPQGSRLIGEYDSQVTFGQRRVLMVWTRLIRPDGSSIVLDRLPGVDATGNSGLEDRVDWHWRRVFQGAALSTLIGVGAELASPGRQANALVTAGQGSIQSTATDVGQEITKRSLDIQPTLTVRAGFPVNIIVNKDILFQAFGRQ